jgi:hypothetical protein
LHLIQFSGGAFCDHFVLAGEYRAGVSIDGDPVSLFHGLAGK